MGIISDSKTEFIISSEQSKALSSIINNRKYALVYVYDVTKVSFNQSRYLFLSESILEIKSDDSSRHDAYYLIMPDFQYSDTADQDFIDNLSRIEKEPIFQVNHATPEDIMVFFSDKRLIFTCNYALFGGGNAEAIMNSKILKLIFRVREKKDYYLCDDYFDIRVYLRSLPSHCDIDQDYMIPIDINEYSISRQLLDIIQKEINDFFENAFIVRYSSISEKIKAQYLLARFYSNPAWDLNPVCILNYRISAFLLPGKMSTEAAQNLTHDKLVLNERENIQYALDSIQCNSDICFNTEEFHNLILGQYLRIAEA
jgi:hypothetical protein